jgi:hypothetical protein
MFNRRRIIQEARAAAWKANDLPLALRAYALWKRLRRTDRAGARAVEVTP